MTFHRDHSESINHPKIVEFLAACKEVRQDGFVHVDEVFESKLLSFAPSLIILRWDEKVGDFHYRLWGTELTKMYGLELTGKYIADGDHAETEKPFIEAHLEAIRDGKLIHLGGTIHWRDKDYRKWNQVIMPLLRDDSIRETLTFVTFD